MNRQRLASIPALLSMILASACASQQPEIRPAAPARPEPPAEAASAMASPEEPATVIDVVPAAAASESAVPYVAAPAEPELVCSFERRTGSNRKIKICRRPQTALDEAETQRTFDSLRRSQMGEPK